MSIGHGSASDISEASSQDASVLSHVTMADDPAEASSPASAVPTQVDRVSPAAEHDAQANAAAPLKDIGVTRSNTICASSIDKSCQNTGNSCREDVLRHPLANGGAPYQDDPLQQQGNVIDTGNAEDTASAVSGSNVQHPTAAVFDPEVAEEAAAADQADGAAVEEPADVLSQPDQAAAAASNSKAVSLTEADASTNPEAAPGKAQPNRSNSRQTQKAMPWR